MFNVEFKESVEKDLRKISKSEIINKIETHLPNKAKILPNLKGEFLGLKKYRIGNYRVIFCIPDETTILITRIGYRSNVYK